MKKFILATLLLLAAFVIATPVVAKPHTFGQLGAAQCDPGAHKLVLNIIYQATNDADSGENHNYWAIDTLTRHIQVFETDSSGVFCVKVKDSGSFVTEDGESPGLATAHVAAGVTGTIEGGYSAILTGSFISDTKDRAKGNIGTRDYACTITGGQINAGCPAYSWLTTYFNVGSFVQSDWGWTYDAGDNGTWVNASTGNIGDITSP